jgi:hypothetical protein
VLWFLVGLGCLRLGNLKFVNRSSVHGRQYPSDHFTAMGRAELECLGVC